MVRTNTFFLRVFLRSIFFLSIYCDGFGQNTFHKLIGTEGNDYAGLFTIEDNFYVIGHTTLDGSDDMYIVKLDLNLDEIWSRTYKSNSGERAAGIVQKSDKNLLISGWGHSGSSSILLEITTDGEIVNSTGLGSFQDRLDLILKTNDGGYLNYGELEGAIPGRNKVALIKYDGNMSIEWKKYYDYNSSGESSTNFEMYGRQAYQLEDGSYVLLGSYTELYNASSSRKIRIIKTDTNGNELWTRGFHGGKMDNAYHFIVTRDNGFLISATTNSYSQGETDILLIKADKDGKTEWSRTYGGTLNEKAGQLVQIENGNFVISGSTESFGSGMMDYILFEVDGHGNLQKAKVYGGDKDDIAVRLITEDQCYYISGYSNSFGHEVNNIYVVKTTMDQVETGCGMDIRNDIRQREVTTSFFDSHYSTGGFVNPSPIILSPKSVESNVYIPCIKCPEGNKIENIICPRERILIDYSDKSSSSVRWQDNDTNPVREIENPGLYWIEYEKNSCMIRDSIIVKLDAEDSLELGPDQIFCPRNTIILNAKMQNAIDYKWNNNSKDSTLIISKSGIYHVVVKTENCEYRDTIEFHNYEPPELDLGNDRVLCLNESIVLNTEIEGALTYRWNTGQAESEILVSSPGVYSVEITTHCNTLKDTIHFIEPDKVNLFVPNIITPNGDGYNDFFTIPSTDSNVELTILNRYGKEIYFSPSYSNNWDGNNLSSGNYYYFLKIGCTQQHYKGWISILR